VIDIHRHVNDLVEFYLRNYVGNGFRIVCNGDGNALKLTGRVETHKHEIINWINIHISLDIKQQRGR